MLKTTVLLNIFSVTFNPFNSSLMNEVIHFFKNNVNGSVWIYLYFLADKSLTVLTFLWHQFDYQFKDVWIWTLILLYKSIPSKLYLSISNFGLIKRKGNTWSISGHISIVTSILLISFWCLVFEYNLYKLILKYQCWYIHQKYCQL